MLIPFLLKKLRRSVGSGRPIYITQARVAEAIALCDTHAEMQGALDFLEVAPFAGGFRCQTSMIASATTATGRRFSVHREDEEWLMAA